MISQSTFLLKPLTGMQGTTTGLQGGVRIYFLKYIKAMKRSKNNFSTHIWWEPNFTHLETVHPITWVAR